MDDLSGLAWSASSNTKPNKAPQGTGNYYPSLRPTPPPQFSGRNTPLSAQGSGSFKAPPKPFAAPKSSTPDSFSNLVSFGSSKTNTLTLQQQQEKLQAEKRKAEEEKRRQYDAQFGAGQAWDRLGAGTPPIASTSRSTTPALQPLPSSFARASSPAAESIQSIGSGGDDDLFAAFNADAPVDKSSYYPPPSIPDSGRSTPAFVAKNQLDLTQPNAWGQPGVLGDDDDPFGLGIKPMNVPAPVPTLEEDDDFLGDLGKPVEEVRRTNPPKSITPELEPQSESDDPWDKAVAELVDMGFSGEQSMRALTESGSGLDIQAAVGWILNDAHRQAKQKQHGGRDQNGSSSRDRREPSQDTGRREESPWSREENRDASRSRRHDNRSPNGDGDTTKAAAAMGNNLFKTANSLWKTSQKKVVKAMNEFQQEADPSQPKWMREAAEREQAERRAAAEGRGRKPQSTLDVTDEALMLEGGGRPPRKSKAPEPRVQSSSNNSRDQSPAMPRPPPERTVPRWQQSAPVSEPRSRITKQAIEEQSAQAYVSPSRRKKTTPQPPPEPEVDIFSTHLPSKQSQPAQQARTSQRLSPVPSKPLTPIPTRPKAPTRQIPSLSPTALANSNQHRLAGTAHFKRGDYASAHQSYTSSLSVLPQSHPITIILLCNRALTSLKTGVPKSAVEDSDTALALIGLSRGDGETVDLGPGEGNGQKDMKEFYGKALMRKAEALEQMERWKDAGEVWKMCVEHGVGAATAIQGRTRCEKALTPKPPPSRTATPKPAPKPMSRPSALSNGGDSAAVKRLREANANAEKADDEKFALSDQVEARINTWKGGKEDNLRALIGSLENVMWEGSGWKKIGLHELVLNNKVKIHYMKAIGKTHPDKLPQNATTEVKMIAALIFAALNESWDSFKKQNGM
ncbi:related to UBA domain-containing protein 7 [Rhynchosporium secalis]|uniref:Related to UBA domain-containing protein 7 n=1 Tax=Rhynchosporium secalis TaxID=38038 RepID=A0A1E1MMT4_RHYSE|nr:related to UBA domain-containing protein 7 [Rhynchosporium secalis]